MDQPPTENLEEGGTAERTDRHSDDPLWPNRRSAGPYLLNGLRKDEEKESRRHSDPERSHLSLWDRTRYDARDLADMLRISV